MIDTIKFRVPIEEGQLKFIKDMAPEKKVSVLGTGEEVIRFWNFPVNLPSSDKNINLIGYDISKYLFIEFSPIKQILGHNIGVVKNEEIQKVVQDLWEYLKAIFIELPHPDTWIVQRIDDAYMWDYGSLEMVTKVFNTLIPFSKTRVKTTVYNGKTKFYLKGLEYLSNTGDYKFLRYRNGRLAEYLKTKSEGYLRFEYKLEGKQVLNNLGYYDWGHIIRLPEDKFLKVAEDKYKKYFNGNTLIKMTQVQVFNKLVEEYGLQLGMTLFCYLQIRDGDMPDKKIALNQISVYQRSRYNSKLKKVGVGINTPSDLPFPSLKSEIMVFDNPLTTYGNHATGVVT